MPGDRHEAEGKRSCDLVVRNAYLVTMDPERRIFSPGSVAIDGSLLVAVGLDEEISRTFAPSRTLDAQGAIVHPGLIDAHVHLSNAGARGAISDSNAKSFLFYTRWWDALTDDDEYANCLLACVEMLRNGTTSFMEAGTVLEPDVAASAAQALGIRGVLADPWLWDMEGNIGGGPIRRAPVSRSRALQLLGSQLRRNANPADLVQGHVALYGIGTESDELLTSAADVAARGHVAVTQHQSYSPVDHSFDESRFGEPPIVHFERLGVLGPGMTFTHLNIANDEETRHLIESGSSVIWCLTTSMTKGLGGTLSCRHDEFHRAGLPVALGSDSAHSALRFDVTLQGMLAVLTTREKRGRRDALLVEDALEMMTISAARVIGMDDRIGSLEEGKRADLVVRTANLPEAQPGSDRLRSLLFSEGSKSVDTVIVDGRVVITKGSCVTLDEAEIYSRARASVREVLQRIETEPSGTHWPVVKERPVAAKDGFLAVPGASGQRRN